MKIDEFQGFLGVAGIPRTPQEYFGSVAMARYTVRRLFRIIDEQARQAGLDPLQHQALIQIFGAGDDVLRINDVAERLDIAPAFASRLTRELEGKGLVERRASEHDRRITLVRASVAGRDLLTSIDRDVRVHVTYFHSQISSDIQARVLAIFAFYVGIPFDADDVDALHTMVDTATHRGARVD